MIFHVEKFAKHIHNLVGPTISSRALYSCQLESKTLSDLDIVITKIPVGISEHEVVRLLLNDQACNSIELSSDLVDRLLHRLSPMCH